MLPAAAQLVNAQIVDTTASELTVPAVTQATEGAMVHGPVLNRREAGLVDLRVPAEGDIEIALRDLRRAGIAAPPGGGWVTISSLSGLA